MASAPVPDGRDARPSGSQAEPEPEQRGPGARPRETGRGGGPPSRRLLLRGAIAGLAGVGVGVGGHYLVQKALADTEGSTTGESPRLRKPARVPGAMPTPLWYQKIDGSLQARPVCWGTRVLIVSTDRALLGFETRTGRVLWKKPDLRLPQLPQSSTNARRTVIVCSSKGEILGLNALSGKARGLENAYRTGNKATGPALKELLAVDGHLVWLAAVTSSNDDTSDKVELVAYDTRRRKELWRRKEEPTLLARLNGGSVVTPLKKYLVRADGRSRDDVDKRPDGKTTEKLVFTALDPRSGAEISSVAMNDVPGHAGFRLSGDGTALVTTPGGPLTRHDLMKGTELWSHSAPGEGALGLAVEHGDVVYVTDERRRTYALDKKNGAVVWEREGAWTDKVRRMPSTLVSASGKVVFAEDRSEVAAFAAKDGRPLWRFADSAPTWGHSAEEARYLTFAPGQVFLLKGSDLYSIPEG